MSIWKSNPELMSRLVTAQLHPANVNIDILTVAWSCDSRDELLAHVERYEAKAIRHECIAAVKAALFPRRRKVA